jgi:hypothetical protein
MLVLVVVFCTGKTGLGYAWDLGKRDTRGTWENGTHGEPGKNVQNSLTNVHCYNE